MGSQSISWGRAWVAGICVAVALGGSLTPVLGQAPTMGRQEVVARALSSNLGIQMSRLQGASAEINDSWGAAGALPRVALTATSSAAVTDQTRNPTAFLQQRILAQSVQWGGTVNWTLFDGMGMFANKRALELLAQQSAGATDLLVEQTVQAVLMAYDATVVQLALLETLEASMALSRERLAFVEKRREAGQAVEWDRLQALQGLVADSMAWLQQQQAWDTARRNVNRLMGDAEEVLWLPAEGLKEPPALPAESLAAGRDALLSNGTAIRNAVLGSMLAKTAVDQAQSRLYPVVGLTANFGDQRSHFEADAFERDGRTLNSSAQLTLNFNLFNGGATRRAIEQARIQQEMAGLGESQERQEALRQWEAARFRMETQAGMYRLAQQATAQAEQLVEIARDRLDLGMFNSLAFRDAQLALQRAQVQEVVALQAGWSAFYELERLRGALRVGIEPVP